MIPWWLVVPSALASPQKICVEVDPDFDDNLDNVTSTANIDGYYAMDDDYLSQGDDQPARGFAYSVVRNSDGDLKEGYLAESGADTGCATVDLVTGVAHTVRIFSEVSVNGQTPYVMDDPTSGQVGVKVLSLSWTPTILGEVNFSVTSLSHRFHVATALSWAVHHRDGGLPNQDWDIYSEPCASGGSCYDDSYDAVFIDDGHYERYVMVHEFGHYIAHRKLGGGGNANYAITGGCDNLAGSQHSLQSQEYQTAAFWEGFADFYTAVTANESADLIDYNCDTWS